MKPSAITQLQVDALSGFATAFDSLVAGATVEYNEEFGLMVSSTWPAEDWNQGLCEAGIAAGKAKEGLARFGQSALCEPVSDWSRSIATPNEVSISEVQAAIRAGLGAAQSQLALDLAHERGFTGILASFIRWPQSLREAVGGSERQQHAASALGIGGQIIAGLAVAGIVPLAGWGLAQLFG